MRYVALLRGISPLNPNMRSEKLRGLFERLGFAHVPTVISSGNVLFETRSRAAGALEAKIERALPARLGFTSTAIIRSREQLVSLVKRDPFRGLEDGPASRLNVTFLKRRPGVRLKFPHTSDDGSFALLDLYEQAICSVTDLTRTRTPDLMGWLDRTYGKEITTRTWRTVGRIVRGLV